MPRQLRPAVAPRSSLTMSITTRNLPSSAAIRCAGLLGGVVDVFVTIAIVHRFEDVRAGNAQSARCQLGAHPIVVVGKESERAELAQPVAGLADLVEHLLPRRGPGHVGQVDAP